MLNPRPSPRRRVLGAILCVLLIAVLVPVAFFLPTALAQSIRGCDYLAAGIALFVLAAVIELIVFIAKAILASLRSRRQE